MIYNEVEYASILPPDWLWVVILNVGIFLIGGWCGYQWAIKTDWVIKQQDSRRALHSVIEKVIFNMEKTGMLKWEWKSDFTAVGDATLNYMQFVWKRTAIKLRAELDTYRDLENQQPISKEAISEILARIRKLSSKRCFCF